MEELRDIDDVVNLLEAEYGSERIVIEPRFEAEKAYYPDIAVLQNIENMEPFLIVEWSSLRTNHRVEKDLKVISETISETTATYGALFGPGVQFVFSKPGSIYRSYGELPQPDSEAPTKRRAIQSKSELAFLVELALDAIESTKEIPQRRGGSTAEFFEAIQLLLELRHSEISSVDDINQEVISELYSQLSWNFSADQTTHEVDHRFVTATAELFNGYEFSTTDNEILELLFDYIEYDKREGAYSTPLQIAEQLVRLSEIEPGHRVLDPASGHGSILSLAANKGAITTGVEINEEVFRKAKFLTKLQNQETDYILGNFFELEEDQFDNTNFDRVISNPPFGMNIDGGKIPGIDRKKNVTSEVGFIAKSLALLGENGRITLSVPANFLHSARDEWFRIHICQNHQIESLIQLVDCPIYTHTNIDTAIITISNKQPDEKHEVKCAVLDSPNNPPQALDEAVTSIVSDDAETINQKELKKSWDLYLLRKQNTVQEHLRSRFEHLVSLEDVASVSSGNPPNELVETQGDDDLVYLSISDIGKQKSRHGDRFIPREQARIVADESCVLLSTLGEYTYTHVPSEPVAPAQDLAVIRFESPQHAKVYEYFFSTDLWNDQLQAFKSGSHIPRVNIRDLRELMVPKFTDEEIEKRARAILILNKREQDLERKLAEFDTNSLSLIEDPDEFLGGGIGNE